MVCAGRGVIGHHDPVVKHRSNGGGGAAPSGRRTRGGGGASQPTQNGSNGTHVITEGVKSALAQIAASTIHHHEEAPAEPAVAAEPVERPKKPRKKRGESSAKSPKSEKELLLDSVLDALPEPKAPGQGRGRRRVTTAALTGTPVAHVPSED